MTAKVVERFQIYVHHVGTVKAGTSVIDLPKTVDTEAPFALRGVAVRVSRNLTVTSYSSVNNLLLRWKSPWNAYTSSDLLPPAVLLRVGTGGLGGIGGCPGPVSPQMVYPAGSTINVDVKNTGATDLDVWMYYWGVKLFPAGVIDLPTYPARCSMVDYRRQFTIKALGLTETNRGQQTVKIGADADYVVRGGQSGCNNTFPAFPANFAAYNNVRLTVSDHNLKPYMDDGVDINYLFGTQQSTFGQGSGFTGNANAGLCVPEIYVRANDALYLNFIREDGAFVGGVGQGPNDIQVAFIGAKVYLK